MALDGSDHPAPPPEIENVSAILNAFSKGTPVDVTVDDLVRVRVSATLTVLSVEILASTLDPAMKQNIETAFVGAMNTALQRTALLAGQALTAPHADPGHTKGTPAG
jgi:DNA-binding protein YbaB